MYLCVKYSQNESVKTKRKQKTENNKRDYYRLHIILQIVKRPLNREITENFSK